MVDRSESSDSENVLQLANEYDTDLHTGSLKVVGFDGATVGGAEITLAPTSVLTGLDKAKTNSDGYVYFSLPEEACHVVAVQLGEQKEILYLEEQQDRVYLPRAPQQISSLLFLFSIYHAGSP